MLLRATNPSEMSFGSWYTSSPSQSLATCLLRCAQCIPTEDHQYLRDPPCTRATTVCFLTSVSCPGVFAGPPCTRAASPQCTRATRRAPSHTATCIPSGPLEVTVHQRSSKWVAATAFAHSDERSFLLIWIAVYAQDSRPVPLLTSLYSLLPFQRIQQPSPARYSSIPTQLLLFWSVYLLVCRLSPVNPPVESSSLKQHSQTRYSEPVATNNALLCINGSKPRLLQSSAAAFTSTQGLLVWSLHGQL
jgi:hypothetical protein